VEPELDAVYLSQRPVHDDRIFDLRGLAVAHAFVGATLGDTSRRTPS
jgi:hypothetical protein